jgi:hypothetical protein
MHNTYTRPLLVQARYSRLYFIKGSSGCNGSLITRTVICLTTAKLKSLVFLRYLNLAVVRHMAALVIKLPLQPELPLIRHNLMWSRADHYMPPSLTIRSLSKSYLLRVKLQVPLLSLPPALSPFVAGNGGDTSRPSIIHFWREGRRRRNTSRVFQFFFLLLRLIKRENSE